MITNAMFTTEPSFIAACEAAKVKPTTAQASKYRRGFGAAYTTEHNLPLGSLVKQHMRPETLDDVTPKGKTKPQSHGPYSATPGGTVVVKKK